MPISTQISTIQTVKHVSTGQLSTGSKNGFFKTSPLGSCVAVIAYDNTTNIGGIAHIMLPGKLIKVIKSEENKYAENAIANLLLELNQQGALDTNIEICLVGGANVLRRENDTIADNLVFCILEIIKQKKLNIKKTSLGGYERRTASLNLHSGIVTFSIGDKNEELLFDFITHNAGGTCYE